jgi:phosphoglycerate dehydrogenase-like enzyme
MKALFLGHFAASVAPRILAKVKTPLETSILDDESDAAHLAPLLVDAEIVAGHIWRAGFPPAPRLRLLQSVAAGVDLLDTGAIPKSVTVCNVFGHEPAIAEYVIMTMLVLTHRLFEAVTMFRAGSWLRALNSAAAPPMAKFWGGRSGSSATVGLGAKWRSAPRGSNAASSPPTAARSPIPRRPKRFTRSPRSTACCRFAIRS